MACGILALIMRLVGSLDLLPLVVAPFLWSPLSGSPEPALVAVAGEALWSTAGGSTADPPDHRTTWQPGVPRGPPVEGSESPGGKGTGTAPHDLPIPHAQRVTLVGEGGAAPPTSGPGPAEWSRADGAKGSVCGAATSQPPGAVGVLGLSRADQRTAASPDSLLGRGPSRQGLLREHRPAAPQGGPSEALVSGGHRGAGGGRDPEPQDRAARASMAGDCDAVPAGPPSGATEEAATPRRSRGGTKGTCAVDTWGASPSASLHLARPWLQRVWDLPLSALATACLQDRRCPRPLFAPSLTGPVPFWDAPISPFEEEPAVTAAWSHPASPTFDSRVQAPSSVRQHAAAWASVFHEHPHCSALSTWATFGFPDMCSLQTSAARDVANPRFSPAEAVEVSTWLDEQIAGGHMIDLGPSPPQPHFISPITCAPKPGSTRLRICHNLSSPRGSSVNTATAFSPHLEPMGLGTVADIVHRARHVLTAGTTGEVWGFRIDLLGCYRQFDLRRHAWWRYCLRWRGRVLAHRAVIWGARGAAHVVSIVTQAICDMLAQEGHWVTAYLDDFIGIAASREEAWAAVRALRRILATLGLVEATPKFVEPARDFVALGVRFDFTSGVIAVTPERAASLSQRLQSVLCGRVSRKEVESITGRLLFVAPLFVHGRMRVYPWWRWLAGWDSLGNSGPTAPPEVAVSAQWWLRQLSPGPGDLAYSLTTALTPTLSVLVGVQSDSCDQGFGWVCPSLLRYICGEWTPEEVEALSSNARELATVVLGLVAHAPLLSGHIVVAETDNFTSFCAVNNEGADDEILRLLVNVLFWAAELFCFLPVLHWLQGSKNTVTDALSRHELPAEWLAHDGSHLVDDWTASPIPSSLRSLFWTELRPGSDTRPRLRRLVSRLWQRGTTFGPPTVAGICPISAESGYPLWKATFPLFV